MRWKQLSNTFISIRQNSNKALTNFFHTICFRTFSLGLWVFDTSMWQSRDITVKALRVGGGTYNQRWWMWVGDQSGYQLQSSITPRAMLELLWGVACAKCKLHFSLAPRRFWTIFSEVIFKPIVVIDGLSSYEYHWDLLVMSQVMTWCHHTPNHYLGQCWPKSLLPYGITRRQWGTFPYTCIIRIVSIVKEIEICQDKYIRQHLILP